MTVLCTLGHVSPDGSAFCDECGEPLNSELSTAPTVPTSHANAASATAETVLCPSCGTANAGNEDFCTNCGILLQADSTPSPAGQAEVHETHFDTLRRPRLIVEADQQEFDLSGRNVVTIGRQDVDSIPDVDLLPHGAEEGYVSRLHARIFLENGQYMLEDENSTNYTFLNRQRLAPKAPVQLHDNDLIRLGKVHLRFKTTE